MIFFKYISKQAMKILLKHLSALNIILGGVIFLLNRKIKIFDFFYLVKNNMLISVDIELIDNKFIC